MAPRQRAATVANSGGTGITRIEVEILQREFYQRPTVDVARALLGARLVRVDHNVRLVGVIVEAEAYVGESDLACHARSGKTKRNAAMYGQPGYAYVYFTYGNHWMLNVVTECPGFPAAVLLRAIQPLEGEQVMDKRRHGGDTLGPGKLTQALGINGELNMADLCTRAAGLWIEPGEAIAEDDIISGPRVGLNTVPEPWKSIGWRFRVRRR
jgi:DNA-3-methyladenine glycosylase